MTDSPTTISTPELDQQVMLLCHMADQIRETLRKSNTNMPYGTMDGLAQLSGSLQRLSRQIKHKEEERRNLQALADIGQVVNSSLELSDVLRIVMDTIVRLTGAERGFLMLREGGNRQGELVTSIARNWEQESINANEFAISGTIINRVVNEGQPVLTTNAQEDPRFGGQESIIAYNLRSILCVPLKVKDEITGVIYADNRIRTGIFTESERDLLTAFANQAAVAIENARLFESVRSTLAEVTELKNLMDNVFASIASGVITADVEDKIVLCNRATESILGRRADDLIGSSVDNILPPVASDLARFINSVRQNDQYLVGLEFNPVLPDRGLVALSLNLSPLKDAMQATQGVTIVLDDLTEKKRLEARSRLFGRMVSPAVIEQLDPDKLQLGGKRTEITALFADVRGFTSFSETLDPVQLVSVLNRYLAAAADAVLDQQGTIDKFLGDAVMAWFNAPIPQADHTLRAVRAALGICDAIHGLHRDLSPEFHLSFGVGIHFGEAVLGLIGTELKIEYTAIGDSVNTAKRIQENAAGGQILISAEADAQVADRVEVRHVDASHAKGKRQPVQVYEVIGLK
ncbi:MAG: adenylate/guanylate cyclase domain-containing protein [Chloroflexota bacterium]|nr:MAG: adenylate/guanylate cyclase domain-containing protein [Chloroflexota bacterium]